MKTTDLVLAVLLLPAIAEAQQAPSPGSAVFGAFRGSTPADAPIRRLLDIPVDSDAELIEWSLVLHADRSSGAPTDYRLQIRYGRTVPNRPGLGDEIASLEHKAAWKIVRSTEANRDVDVCELANTVSLRQISSTVLHVLDPDGSLMVGNGGWSYTLNRSDACEPRVERSTAPPPQTKARTLEPLPSGPTVFGIFEGRTPCQRIARELKIAAPAGCAKVKWRVTLFQDAAHHRPTTYRIEGTLHRTARTGAWHIERGDATSAFVYVLAATTSEGALALMRGDDNVLFMVDAERRPLTGHAEFSYTLDRRP